MPDPMLAAVAALDLNDLLGLVRRELGPEFESGRDGLGPKLDTASMSAEDLAGLLLGARGNDALVGADVGKDLRRLLLARWAKRDWLAEQCEARGKSAARRHTSTLIGELADGTFRPGGRFARALCEHLGLPAVFAGTPASARRPDQLVEAVVRLRPRWPHQEDAVRLVLEHWSGANEHGHLPALLCMPTGAGKSRCAADAVAEWALAAIAQGHPAPIRIIWVAHTRELLDQAAEALARSYMDVSARLGGTHGDGILRGPLFVARLDREGPLDYGLPVADREAACEVLLVSNQKLAGVLPRARTYADRHKIYLALGEPDLIVIDESHRSEAKTYRPLVPGRGQERLPWRVLGLTATPYRTDNKEAKQLAARYRHQLLDPFAGRDAYAELEAEGVLAQVLPVVVKTGTRVPLDGAGTDDFGDTITQEVLDHLAGDRRRNGVLIDRIVEQARLRQVLVFACNKRHARRIAAVLRQQGVPAAALLGETTPGTRDQRVKEFRAGAIRVLVTVDLVVAGFDAPGVGAVVMGRPTFSPVRYMQMLGRGLRGARSGGTENCVVVDLCDNFGRFGGRVVHYALIRRGWQRTR